MMTLSASVVLALNYEGEDFCQEHPAWPNGTYLGQMHPLHSDFYRGYAERRGWDPCTTWANDQRNSAIKGLQALGYTVTDPGAAPAGVDPLGPMGLYGQCRNAAGTYVRILDVTEGLWSCWGITSGSLARFGTVDLDGRGLLRIRGQLVRLPSGLPIRLDGLYFLRGPQDGTITTYHEEKGTGPVSGEYWGW
ncbi:MAG: hypothetical protein OXU21_03215 [Chloroflexota bacterium]|nr:hypothetical protein [Chloroflexota bacterium]